MFRLRCGTSVVELVVLVTIVAALGIVLANLVLPPSETFTGAVNDVFWATGHQTPYVLIYRDDLGVTDTFILPPGFSNIMVGRRYAFRVRGENFHPSSYRLVTKAIPIP